MKNTTPIWMSDWIFINNKGVKRTIEGVIVKGNDADEIMNNKMLITRALRKLKGLRKNHTFRVLEVKLKTQHGYGPSYEQERAKSIFKR